MSIEKVTRALLSIFRLFKMVPEGLPVPEGSELTSSSSSSSKGIVQEDTIEADRKLARLELPELEAEETDDTVDIVEIGDMVEVLPLRELRPLSL